MTERIHHTPLGDIHYWVSISRSTNATLVFLPGLTADHRLFDKQIAYFQDKCNFLVWDAPGHGASWPFALHFSLTDKARWLEEILLSENVECPVIIGQSMGGYVGQMYAQLFPKRLKGFVAVDSAPLQRRYMTGAELWLLKHMKPIYRLYPWKSLLKAGSNGVATTAYGRALMREMMMTYEGNQARYAALSGHGMRMLAQAVEADLPYDIPCPAQLICGTEDRAGSCRRYSKVWSRDTGLPLTWIAHAGHNANTDAPDEVNALIEQLLICVNETER